MHIEESNNLVQNNAPETRDPSKRFEIQCGLTLAIFAAALAVTDLYAGKFGDDEIKMTNEKASSFMWYQSKSIKESLTAGQRDLLQTLTTSGAIASGHLNAVQTRIENLASDIQKYKREKQEILLGSANVGKENWVQEVNGDYGKIIGAQEYAAMADQLGSQGDKLDIASLFLQLCLVMGAVSLVLQSRRSQVFFYSLMVGFGSIGAGFTLWTFMV